MVWITAFFTEGFSPKTGLSPIVDVYRISDNFRVVAAQTMTQIGGGYYKYNFADYDDTEEYVVIADGGVGISNMERYKFASTEDADNKATFQDADYMRAKYHKLLEGARAMQPVLDIEEGRWFIDENLKQQFFYVGNGPVLAAVFNLLDITGAPSHTDVFERVAADFEGAPELACGFTVKQTGKYAELAAEFEVVP